MKVKTGIDSHRYLDLENDENDYEDSEYNDDLFDDDFDEDYEYEDYEHEDGPSRTKFLWSRFLLVITIIVAIILAILPGVSLKSSKYWSQDIHLSQFQYRPQVPHYQTCKNR